MNMKISSPKPMGFAGLPRVMRAPKVSATRAVTARAMETEDAKMREAEARWDAQLADGIVKNVMAKDVMSMTDEWTILDVRPPAEVKKVRVKGAVEVPLFVPDTSVDPGSLLKQMSAFGMGGWWLGGQHMKANESFLADVQAKVPKDSKVLVACQKGLRSLAACEQLNRAGYQDLAWINGGMDNSLPGQIATVDDKDVRYGGIGGVSEMIGWTEVQSKETGPLGPAKNVLLLVALVVVLDGLVFAYEYISVLQGKTPFQ